VWERGGAGGVDLAVAVLGAINGQASHFRPLYPDDMSLSDKIEVIATTLYGADAVRFLPAAVRKLARYETQGQGRLPVCMAKTQSSLSDDPQRVGRPRGFSVTIRDAKLSAGAGFVVAYAGEIMTMPGLPRKPAAEMIDLDPAGNVVGLF
jgi:formate--tetrahydrofolate ligase